MLIISLSVLVNDTPNDRQYYGEGYYSKCYPKIHSSPIILSQIIADNPINIKTNI